MFLSLLKTQLLVKKSIHSVSAKTKILYTDYEHGVAVIYTCGNVLADDTCAHDKLHVDVMTRERNAHLSVATLEKLKHVVAEACFEAGDFGETEHARTCAVNKKASRICKLDEMPVQVDFDAKKVRAHFCFKLDIPPLNWNFQKCTLTYQKCVASFDLLPMV